MPGHGDECVAHETVREVEAQRLIDPEHLEGLGGRLAAGQLSADNWIAMATRMEEQEEAQRETEEGSKEREENRGA